ncbi:hypothetical protein [Falsiroseomonas sp. HW251]|uniref:hypothetical protein n=1 Tax=Falsiroseomonas sp. HW251 TaxID=3390998 RepID=UPI003D311E15
MQDPDRTLGQLAIRSLQRGLDRGLPAPPAPRRPKRRGAPADLAAIDFSRPLPARATRLPPGFVAVLVVMAVMLAAMVASLALRLR